MARGDAREPGWVRPFCCESSRHSQKAGAILQIMPVAWPIGLALSYKGRYCHATPIQRPAARFKQGFGRISSTIESVTGRPSTDLRQLIFPKLVLLFIGRALPGERQPGET